MGNLGMAQGESLVRCGARLRPLLLQGVAKVTYKSAHKFHACQPGPPSGTARAAGQVTD